MEQAEEAKILGSKKQQALPHNLNAKVRERLKTRQAEHTIRGMFWDATCYHMPPHKHIPKRNLIQNRLEILHRHQLLRNKPQFHSTPGSLPVVTQVQVFLIERYLF